MDTSFEKASSRHLLTTENIYKEEEGKDKLHPSPTNPQSNQHFWGEKKQEWIIIVIAHQQISADKQIERV